MGAIPNDDLAVAAGLAVVVVVVEPDRYVKSSWMRCWRSNTASASGRPGRNDTAAGTSPGPALPKLPRLSAS